MQGNFDVYELDVAKCQIYMPDDKFMYIGNVTVKDGIRSGSGFGAPIKNDRNRNPARN